MMQIRVSGLLTPGLLAVLLWVGNAHAVPCQNDLPPSNPDSVYTDHGNGTVTDTRTGLMWKQCAEGSTGATCQTGAEQTFTWVNALVQAETSTFANYTDWRLPNVKELTSLVDDCRASPAINTIRFPNTLSGWFWSGSPNDFSWDLAWVVHFGFGDVSSLGRSQSNHVRLVRSGRKAAVIVHPGETHAGVTFGPNGTISVDEKTLFEDISLGLTEEPNFDYFYLRVYEAGAGVRIVELYEIGEDLNVNLDDPLLATARVSAEGDILEEVILQGN